MFNFIPKTTLVALFLTAALAPAFAEPDKTTEKKVEPPTPVVVQVTPVALPIPIPQAKKTPDQREPIKKPVWRGEAPPDFKIHEF